MSVIVMPSARSKIILPRRARPAGMVVARCHVRSVRRSEGVRRMIREVLRPRAIQRPCVLRVEIVTKPARFFTCDDALHMGGRHSPIVQHCFNGFSLAGSLQKGRIMLANLFQGSRSTFS